MPRFHPFRLPYRLRRKPIRTRMTLLLYLLLLLLLLLTPFYVVYKPPNLLIRWLQHRNPTVLFHVPTTRPLIALTIDDAPSAHTSTLAALLAAHGAHATFFLLGAQVPSHEATLSALVAAGHELANHAMHDEPSRGLSDAELGTQLDAVDALIRIAYADAPAPPPPRYFRPGSGFFSARMLAVLAARGYHLVLGSVYPHDAQVPFWRVNAAHVLSMVRPGAVVVCHDRRSWTAPMLEKVLPELTRRGYKVVTVTELLQAAEEEAREAGG